MVQLSPIAPYCVLLLLSAARDLELAEQEYQCWLLQQQGQQNRLPSEQQHAEQPPAQSQARIENEAKDEESPSTSCSQEGKEKEPTALETTDAATDNASGNSFLHETQSTIGLLGGDELGQPKAANPPHVLDNFWNHRMDTAKDSAAAVDSSSSSTTNRDEIAKIRREQEQLSQQQRQLMQQQERLLKQQQKLLEQQQQQQQHYCQQQQQASSSLASFSSTWWWILLSSTMLRTATETITTMASNHHKGHHDPQPFDDSNRLLENDISNNRPRILRLNQNNPSSTNEDQEQSENFPANILQDDDDNDENRVDNLRHCVWATALLVPVIGIMMRELVNNLWTDDLGSVAVEATMDLILIGALVWWLVQDWRRVCMPVSKGNDLRCNDDDTVDRKEEWVSHDSFPFQVVAFFQKLGGQGQEATIPRSSPSRNMNEPTTRQDEFDPKLVQSVIDEMTASTTTTSRSIPMDDQLEIPTLIAGRRQRRADKNKR